MKDLHPPPKKKAQHNLPCSLRAPNPGNAEVEADKGLEEEEEDDAGEDHRAVDKECHVGDVVLLL